MAKITIDLKMLAKLFAKSAAHKELPTPIRQFAAQMTVLTVHLQRIEARVANEETARLASEKELDERLGEAISLLASGRTAEPDESEVHQQRPNQPTEGGKNGESEGVAEDDPEGAAAEEMAARVLRETEEEAAAIAAGKQKPPAAVVPLKKPTPPVAPKAPAPDGAAS